MTLKRRPKHNPPPDAPEGIVSFDFVRFFPHRFWTSNWAKDAEYPGGFRYKILSVRDEDKNTIEAVILREEPGGYKEETNRAPALTPAGFERDLAEIVAEMQRTFGIQFEEHDMSFVRSENEFLECMEDFGWHDWEPEKPN
jgi:hypothetical protein